MMRSCRVGSVAIEIGFLVQRAKAETAEVGVEDGVALASSPDLSALAAQLCVEHEAVTAVAATGLAAEAAGDDRCRDHQGPYRGGSAAGASLPEPPSMMLAPALPVVVLASALPVPLTP
jgi:hypothetical protein